MATSGCRFSSYKFFISLNRNSSSFLEVWIQVSEPNHTGQLGSRAHPLELGLATLEPGGLRVAADASLKEQAGCY